MIKQRHIRLALVGGLLNTTALIAPAAAQQATTVPFPVRQYQDENGVDLLSGVFTTASPMISIGGPDMGLNYVREVRQAAFRENILWNVAVNGTTYTVATGTTSDVFTQSGTSFVPKEANGSSLSFNSTTSTYTYTGSDGTVATFIQRPFNFTFGNVTALSVDTITFPDGKVLTYTYHEDSYTTAHLTRYGRRLQAVSSNTG